MITTVLLALLLACCLLCFVIASQNPVADRGMAGESSLGRPIRLLGTIFGLIFLVVLFFSTFTLVRATEVGVPVSFGSVGKPLASGVHFTAPWVSIETYPTRPLKVDVTGKVRTADAGTVTVDTTTRWKVNTADARELYFQVRTGDEDKISQDIVNANLHQAIGDVYNKVSNVDATKRDGRAEAIQGRLQQLVRQYGITITSLQLRSVDPDSTTAQSIADYAAQLRKTQIAKEANNTAAADAQRRLTDATGLKNAAAQIPSITSAQAYALCVQAWERVITSGKTVYATPCGGSGAVPTVPTK